MKKIICNIKEKMGGQQVADMGVFILFSVVTLAFLISFMRFYVL